MLAITNCSQLVTLAGPARPRIGPELRELGVIDRGVLLIDGERILAVGSDVEIPSGADVVDAKAGVVMPGFIDAHTHPVFAGNRAGEFERRMAGATYQEIAAEGGGIRSTVRQTRAATEDDLYAQALRYAQWFLRCGATTIEAKSGYGLTLDDELKLLRVIRRMNTDGPLRCVPTFLGAHEVPDEYRGRAKEYVDVVVNQMIPAVARERLAEYCDVFCEPGIFDIEASRRVLTAARAHGLGLRMHADQLSDSNGSGLAAELQVATADHLECTDAAGIESLREAGVQPVLLPGSAYALGSGLYPDARAMIDAGLAIVLATDFNPGSSPTPSMLMVLSLAMTQMKMTAAEGISAATINAAYSLGRGAEIGSLEPGKRADFVIHDCRDYRELPYFFGIEHPRAVYAGGELVYSR